MSTALRQIVGEAVFNFNLKKMKIAPLLIFAGLILVGTGCTSYQSILNFNKSEGLPTQPIPISNFTPITIQPNDILTIRIIPPEVGLQQLFSSGEPDKGPSNLNDYLVNSQGEIEIPRLGSIRVEGLRTQDIQAEIVARLQPYYKEEPVVQVQLANFKVNVNGEVQRPGTFSVLNNRLTIIDAITLAGDFTDYSKRDSVMVIREEDGFRKFGYLDFTSTDLFTSPYFYLKQNDVIYVQPSKGKLSTVRDQVSKFLPWVSVGVSVILLTTTLIRL